MKGRQTEWSPVCVAMLLTHNGLKISRAQNVGRGYFCRPHGGRESDDLATTGGTLILNALVLIWLALRGAEALRPSSS
jgi:hypothetical protein